MDLLYWLRRYERLKIGEKKEMELIEEVKEGRPVMHRYKGR